MEYKEKKTKKKTEKVEIEETNEERMYEETYTRKLELEDPPAYTPAWYQMKRQRKLQARALWDMFSRGELIQQTVEIPKVGGGVVRKEVLFSHKNVFAV